MIFAGAYAGRTCPECGAEYMRTASASLLFYLILIGVGTVALVPPTVSRVGEGALAWALAAGACVALILVLGALTDVLVRSQTPLPDECPQCGVEMIQVGGRYDGMLPTPQDVLILIGYVAAVWVVTRLLIP